MTIHIGPIVMKVTAATFKATSLQLLARASRSRETIVVTKRGKPFVKIRVDSDEASKRASIFGALRDKILYAAPTEELFSTGAKWNVVEDE